MTQIHLTLALLALLILVLILALSIHRSSATARQQAAAWRYLDWDDESLAMLRAQLQPAADSKQSKEQQAMRLAVEQAMAMRAAFARRIAGTRHDFRAAGLVELRLVGLSQRGTDYEAGPVCIGRLNLEALYRSGRLACVSDPASERASFAAVMTRETLRHFMLAENDPWFLPTFRWYSSLPGSVNLVLAHLAPLTPESDTKIPAPKQEA